MDEPNSAQRLQSGVEVTIAGSVKNGALALESQQAVVEQADDTSIRVTVAPSFAFAVPGLTVFLQLADGSAGWTQVLDVSPSNDGLRLFLGPARWEDPGAERALRTPCDFRIVATWISIDAESREKTTKRSVGGALNISRSGVRFRLRSLVAVGTLMQLQIYYNVHDCITAMSKVVRVADAEHEMKGFEVGATFVRVLSGLEILSAITAEAA